MTQKEYVVFASQVESFLRGKGATPVGHNARGEPVWKSAKATYVVVAGREVSRRRIREINSCAC